MSPARRDASNTTLYLFLTLIRTGLSPHIPDRCEVMDSTLRHVSTMGPLHASKGFISGSLRRKTGRLNSQAEKDSSFFKPAAAFTTAAPCFTEKFCQSGSSSVCPELLVPASQVMPQRCLSKEGSFVSKPTSTWGSLPLLGPQYCSSLYLDLSSPTATFLQGPILQRCFAKAGSTIFSSLNQSLFPGLGDHTSNWSALVFLIHYHTSPNPPLKLKMHHVPFVYNRACLSMMKGHTLEIPTKSLFTWRGMRMER